VPKVTIVFQKKKLDVAEKRQPQRVPCLKNCLELYPGTEVHIGVA